MAKKIEGSIASDNSSVYWIVGGKRLEVRVKDLMDDIVARAVAHGINQKVRDSAASAETDAERVARMEATIENLLAGVWNGGGGGNSLLAEAISILKKVSIEDAVAIVGKLDDEQRKLLEKNPKIKLEIQKLQTARTAARVTKQSDADLDELLGDI